jgi:hypothetical protein
MHASSVTPRAGSGCTQLASELSKQICLVLRTGIELAAVAQESGDADLVDFSSRAAHRLYATASMLVERDELDENDWEQLNRDLERLSEMLRPGH